MRVLPLLALCILTSVLTWAQRQNEWSFHLRNGILLNKSGLHCEYGGRTIAEVKNTFTQSIGGTYTHVLENGILLAGGADLGYEAYQAFINFPFSEYQFEKQPVLATHYYQNAVIPYMQLNINIGYRLKPLGVFIPEVRLGQVLHMPLRYKELDAVSLERPLVGPWGHNREYNFLLYGSYGKAAENRMVCELVNFLYIGTGIRSRMQNIARVNIGIQYQRQLYMLKDESSFYASYYDAFGVKRASEVFNGRHAAINFIVGLVLNGHTANVSKKVEE